MIQKIIVTVLYTCKLSDKGIHSEILINNKVYLTISYTFTMTSSCAMLAGLIGEQFYNPTMIKNFMFCSKFNEL